jgi:hypothetical protein
MTGSKRPGFGWPRDSRSHVPAAGAAARPATRVSDGISATDTRWRDLRAQRRRARGHTQAEATTPPRVSAG